MGSRALCPGKGFVSLRWHLPAAAPEMLEPGGCTDASGVCWKLRVQCLLTFLGWLFALVGCGKHCWISSALGRFIPSAVSVMWLSYRIPKTRNSRRKQELFLGESITTVPMGSLAPCLSQLLERDFGDAPALLDGVRDRK